MVAEPSAVPPRDSDPLAEGRVNPQTRVLWLRSGGLLDVWIVCLALYPLLRMFLGLRAPTMPVLGSWGILAAPRPWHAWPELLDASPCVLLLLLRLPLLRLAGFRPRHPNDEIADGWGHVAAVLAGLGVWFLWIGGGLAVRLVQDGVIADIDWAGVLQNIKQFPVPWLLILIYINLGLALIVGARRRWPFLLRLFGIRR